MDETFEYRPLLDRETLRTLQHRQDAPSLIRLTLHLGAFVACGGLVVMSSPYPFIAAGLSVLLAAIWAKPVCSLSRVYPSNRLSFT